MRLAASRLASVSLAVLLSLAATARADPTPAVMQPVSEPRSPTLAFALSTAGAAAALYMTAEGFDRHDDGLLYASAAMWVVGPSLGNFYGDRYFTDGFLLRSAGLVAYVGAAAWSEHSCHQIDGICGGPFLLGMAGLTGIMVGAAGDILEAPRTARTYNLAHEQLTVFPTVLPAAGGPAAGLALGGSF